MDLTDAIKEAYEYAPGDVVYYDTLEIDHDDFTESIKVVRSHKSLTVTEGTFLPIWFDFRLPEVAASTRGEMTITIAGVPKAARDVIRRAARSRSSISVYYRQYLEGSSDPDAEIPVPFQIRSIKETNSGIEAVAMLPDLVGAYFPRRLFSIADFPGLAV